MIINLTGYIPTPRFDATAWTQARIEESATKDGPWVELETVPLDPVDTDPTNPVPRSFTADTTSPVGYWYRVVFLDTPGEDEQATEPVQNVTDLASDYRPSVGQVAGLMRQRTADTNGRIVGEFTTATSPTGDQVDELIDRAMGHLSQRLGAAPAAALWQAAREVVVLRTAMLIELSYFPSQISPDRSPYNELKALYDQALTDLIDAQLRLGADLEPGTADDTGPEGLPAVSYVASSCAPLGGYVW